MSYPLFSGPGYHMTIIVDSACWSSHRKVQGSNKLIQVILWILSAYSASLIISTPGFNWIQSLKKGGSIMLVLSSFLKLLNAAGWLTCGEYETYEIIIGQSFTLALLLISPLPLCLSGGTWRSRADRRARGQSNWRWPRPPRSSRRAWQTGFPCKFVWHVQMDK